MKYPTIVEVLTISPSVYIIYFEDLLLGTYTLMIAMFF